MRDFIVYGIDWTWRIRADIGISVIICDNDDDKSLQFEVVYFSFSFFCFMISTCLFLSIKYQTHNDEDEYEGCVLDKLKILRVSNPKKVILGHLNINSIPNKFDGIMNIVATGIDFFLISETKIDGSFPDAQFFYNGYSKIHRKDRILRDGGLLMYVNENIPSLILKEHTILDDIEIVCGEINLRKQKWILVGIYRPPGMNENYFFDHLGQVIDYYSTKVDNLVMGDFNSEPSDEQVESFCDSYDLHNLVKEKTCFKGPPKCYDLILTNCKHNFQNTLVLTSGFSDFHKMTVTVLKTEFVKTDPVQINYRDYKKFNISIFNGDLRDKINSDVTSTSNYNRFQNIRREVLDNHAPLKKKYVRVNNSPFMTKSLWKMIMNRSRSKNKYFKNKTAENWEKYRKLRLKGNTSKILISILSMTTKHFGKQLNPFSLRKETATKKRLF